MTDLDRSPSGRPATEGPARPSAWDLAVGAFGPQDGWPPALRQAFDLCLDAPASCAVCWGRDLTLLYNDAFAAGLETLHPWAFGRSFRDVWPQGREVFISRFEAVLAGGVGCIIQDERLFGLRNGVQQVTYWSFVLTPIRAEGGRVEGVSSLAIETTERILAESRSRFLLGLEQRMRASSDPSDVLVLAAESLGRRIGVSEVAYAEIDPEGRLARLRHSWSEADMPSNAGTHRLDDFGPHIAGELRAGRAIVVEDVKSYGPTSSPEALAAYARVSVAAFLNLPVVREGRLRGLFLVHSRAPRAWTREEISLAEDVAERTWTTLARARAEADLRELNETLEERVAERTRERDQSRRASQDILEVIDAGGPSADPNDPTAQEKAIQRLRSALRDAESAVRAKDDFLANMSHELRTPLNSIVGFSGLIAEAPELSAETRRRAKIVSGASQSLVGIVNDVLDISKIQSEGVVLAPEPIHVRDVALSALALVREEAGRKDVALGLDVVGASRRVLLDPSRLRQVILNLVGNALKFTSRGGRITVTLDQADESVIRVAVKDTGVGIPKDRLAVIFDRFAQADSTTTRRFGGTGLGLTISRSIVEAMGGDIGVESELGVGSTFWFTVQPLGAGPALAAPPAAAPGEVSVRGVRLLLADDNEVNRDLFHALMAGCGVEVEDVGDGRAAVAAVAARPFDLVLMDVQMPVMDGLEAARAIRALGFELPIVALTANVMRSQIELCLQAGMNDHLGKPFVARQVHAAIAKWAPAKDPGSLSDSSAGTDVMSALRVTLGADALGAFSSRLADQMRELLTVLAPGALDDLALERRLHKVRGAATSLGFAAVAASYARLEGAARIGAATPDLIDEARRVSEAALREIADAQRAA